jgi:Amt family ammonium transporter
VYCSAIAGLAGITPASGFIDSQSSLVLGVLLGLASYGSVYLLKHKLHIDDALDVRCAGCSALSCCRPAPADLRKISSVHGVTGVVGALAIGFVGWSAVNPASADGLLFGAHSGRLLGVQVMGVVVAGAWAGLVTTALLLTMKYTRIGLRIDEVRLAPAFTCVQGLTSSAGQRRQRYRCSRALGERVPRADPHG